MDILPATPANLRKALQILRRGGVVAHPTDTVWGLAADASKAKAVTNVHAIKQSDASKPMLAIVPRKSYVRQVAVVSTLAAELTKQFWPGAVALLLPGKGVLATEAGSGYVGLRYPADLLSLQLARGLGRPTVTTSANISGQPTARAAEELYKVFARRKHKPDLILDTGFVAPASAQPSTIVDLSRAGSPRLLRVGAGPVPAIRRVLSRHS